MVRVEVVSPGTMIDNSHIDDPVKCTKVPRAVLCKCPKPLKVSTFNSLYVHPVEDCPFAIFLRSGVTVS